MFILIKTGQKSSEHVGTSGTELDLKTSFFYFLRMADFLAKVLQHLKCVPETEDDVYQALRSAPELRLAWFTTQPKQKRKLLEQLQKRKFELMLAGQEEDDGA